MKNKTSNVICIILSLITIGCISGIVVTTPGCKNIINGSWR